MDSKPDSQSAFVKTPVLETLRGQIQGFKDEVRRLLEMTASLPKGEARNEFIAEITSLYSRTESMRQALDSCLSQESNLANAGEPAHGSRDAVTEPAEFAERLDDLRGAIKSNSRSKGNTASSSSSGDRKKIVTARIRHLGWVFSAVVFIAVLLKGLNGQTADLPSIVFISILVSAVFVCLVELVVLAVHRFVG